MSYFAAALARAGDGWSGQEVDLDELTDLESLAEHLHEVGDGDGPRVLLLEEDDEYLAVVRLDVGAAALPEPRVFLSDGRAVQAGGVAAMLWEDAGAEASSDDEGHRPVSEPVGDADLLDDLGVDAHTLRDLCAEEGLLPSDVLSAVCERVGCLDVLEQVREG